MFYNSIYELNLSIRPKGLHSRSDCPTSGDS
jgi:hypothetical protein